MIFIFNITDLIINLTSKNDKQESQRDGCLLLLKAGGRIRGFHLQLLAEQQGDCPNCVQLGPIGVILQADVPHTALLRELYCIS